MSELRDLYQEVILDHTKHPRNYGPLGTATHRASGRNPLCGDQLVLMLDIHHDLVRDAHFAGKGCAISATLRDRTCSWSSGMRPAGSSGFPSLPPSWWGTSPTFWWR